MKGPKTHFARRACSLLILLLAAAPAAWGQASAYVANFSSDNASVIDTSTNTVIATVALGTFPYGVAVGSSRAYVTNVSSGNVSVIDTSTNTVTATVTVGSSPISLGDFVGPGAVPVELQSFAVD